MANERKALVVHYAPGHEAETVGELTDHLNDGWRIVSSTGMGGTGGAASSAQFACLVVLEREDTKTVGGFSTG